MHMLISQYDVRVVKYRTIALQNFLQLNHAYTAVA